MDPIGSIKPHKDSTFAMLLEAQRRGWSLRYMEQRDLFAQNDRAWARTRELRVFDDSRRWYTLGAEAIVALDELTVLLMRKDPPVDLTYVYATHILEIAERKGCLVVNRPQSLRDANEKIFILDFPDLIPPTLVASDGDTIRSFLRDHRDIVIKPLDSMGGASVFRMGAEDPNISVIIETLTRNGQHPAMAQRFLPEIAAGDKRILVVDGTPVDFALARIPALGETRGNLAAGGTGKGQPLSARDRQIADAVGPRLRQMGILFAGLDVIGDHLTEINVTSPTCIREIDREFGLNIAGTLFDRIAERLT